MKLNKANIIDIATVVFVIALVVIGAFYYLSKPVVKATRLTVTVEISDPSQVAAVDDAALAAKIVYLNSINVPVDSAASLQGSSLQVVLTGPGYTDRNGFYYFNGQRLLIGQKAEIHASYFAQGIIVKIENAK